MLEGSDSELVWGANDSEVYYATMDAQHRPWKLWRHVLGTPQAEDTLLLTEENELFWLALHKGAAGRFVFATVASPETSEVHALDLEGGLGARLACVAPRRQGVLYEADHRGDHFLILTNDRQQKNFGLMAAPLTSCSADDWAPLPGFEYDATRCLSGVVAFRDYVACFGREEGITQAWVLDAPAEAAAPTAVHRIAFPEAAFRAGPAANREFGSAQLRLDYSSMVTPPSTLSYDMRGRALTTLKTTEVPGYDPSRYHTERRTATARDGTPIPLSLVYRKDYAGSRRGPAPMMLYGGAACHTTTCRHHFRPTERRLHAQVTARTACAWSRRSYPQRESNSQSP